MYENDMNEILSYSLSKDTKNAVKAFFAIKESYHLDPNPDTTYDLKRKFQTINEDLKQEKSFGRISAADMNSLIEVMRK
jgi:hypothetical protein